LPRKMRVLHVGLGGSCSESLGLLMGVPIQDLS
jgi:hypothetical protein